MYAASDADPRDGVLYEDAVAHPLTHYGVYKLANEGTARVYWQEDGVASYGLRPMTIYGPGRDQGLTSDPTRAVLAALLGRRFEIGFGGRSLFQYAPDAAAAFISAARAGLEGARVSNLGGSPVSIDEFIAALERVVPGAAKLITHAQKPLPFPERIDSASLADLGPLPVTPLDEAMAATVAVFRAALDRGELVPEEHGLG
jgi:nucleoside-diphosphate-sugar epimerase